MKPNLTNQNCSIAYAVEENTIYVDLSEFDPKKVLATLNAISLAISDALPEQNPYGLFWHPRTDEETTLVLCHDALNFQDAAACLVEQLYVSCNNPAHVVVETDATVPVQGNLCAIVTDHLKPHKTGGYVADDRPRATWVWRCRIDKDGIADDVLASLEQAGGELTFV